MKRSAPTAAMETEDAIAAFAALGQQVRLEVFRLLVRAGAEGMTAGDIARAVGAPPNNLSVHLGILTRAGLVTALRDGRSIIYSLEVGGVKDLLSFLLSDCCGGHPELCGPFIGTCEPAKSRRR